MFAFGFASKCTYSQFRDRKQESSNPLLHSWNASKINPIYAYIYTVIYIQIYTYIYACVSNIHRCMSVMETISPVQMMTETVTITLSFVTMDFTYFWLPSSFPPFLPLQRYILGLLWFSLSLLPILLMSSAKNKPRLEATFQSSIYKTKSRVKSEKCTYGIVYIFTPCFRYFTEIRSFYVHFYICSIPVTVRKLKNPNPIPLFAKTIQTRLLHHWYIPDVWFTHSTHALHYTHLRGDPGSWHFNSGKANLDCPK